MLARKKTVVKQNNDGILYLFKKNKVTFFHGRGSFARPRRRRLWQIAVAGAKAGDADRASTSSSRPARTRAPLPGAAVRREERSSPTTARSRIGAVPKTLGIVGSGVIGLEMGSVWRRLGADVTVLEALPTFLGAVDTQVAAEAQKTFTKQGLKIVLGVKISAVETGAGGVSVSYADAAGQGADARLRQADRLDRPRPQHDRPERRGGRPRARRARLRRRSTTTAGRNLENVWAIGDVVRGPMLAHKGEEEGVAVAERIVGQKPHVDFNTVPWVIYTSPEIAWVGQTEQQLKAAGREVRAGTFPFMANGRARALGDTTGFVKVIADAKTDEILGVHMIGPMVSELIAEAVVAMEFKASAEDIGRICHAHPSLSEATKEAALAVDKRALNF